MFCVKCGKEINEGAKFCIACGAPVSKVAQPSNLDDDRTIGLLDAFPIPPKEREDEIRRFISDKIPNNLEDPAVKLQVKRVMTKILPSYVETSNLAALLLECNPVEFARNLCSLDSDSLFHVLSAIDGHMDKREDAVPLNACKDGILFILKERIKRGELHA